ncbi:hypothetical protein Mzhil_0724 [Methanosalsum zhilinae DSM 4017]|uniref:DUF8180 domain-containing protein n=2 Tax=Methanosalsum zhilinae TaxID=39669 RepID=F7XLG5_METZD|nr:hypothetical protein Mzhil_0724 [Methanosalsum zhilinae DSM 4017]
MFEKQNENIGDTMSSEEITKEKLLHLIEHWIEHNDNHVQNFDSWTEKIELSGFEGVAEEIRMASKNMEKCTMHLKKAKSRLE